MKERSKQHPSPSLWPVYPVRSSSSSCANQVHVQCMKLALLGANARTKLRGLTGNFVGRRGKLNRTKQRGGGGVEATLKSGGDSFPVWEESASATASCLLGQYELSQQRRRHSPITTSREVILSRPNKQMTGAQTDSAGQTRQYMNTMNH